MDEDRGPKLGTVVLENGGFWTATADEEGGCGRLKTRDEERATVTGAVVFGNGVGIITADEEGAATSVAVAPENGRVWTDAAGDGGGEA
jgi:hypothetical protein